MKKIKVLIVDDSKLIQQVLTKIFSEDEEFQVVGCADDPFMARDMIKKLNPTILTLDIMMPHMDGITFLKNLMRLHPMPVVMISSLTQKGSAFSLEALSIGAVDFIPKPSFEDFSSKDYAKIIREVVKNAAAVNVLTPAERKKFSVHPDLEKFSLQPNLLRTGIITIGASTGGIEALETILKPLPKVFPPILIAQHIKKEFNAAFSERINKLCNLTVVQAENHAIISPGFVYIAPGDAHMSVDKTSKGYVVALQNKGPVNGHKPSIDVLFESVARVGKFNSIGILLTGMGSDGAEGLKAIHDAGGITIAQDKDSSVVWGMPGAAVKLKAVDHIMPLESIALKLMQILDKKVLSLPTETDMSRSL